ncbi:FAD-dependent oxidoreductase [Oscillatoria sp. FACHB-1406]|uniref:FAD-dependent oxidoreductase n=1 Tax=Oscillatoria sp. FACHB-1406 TaxID=2692846 RepID=UPI00168887A8|nr:FAD-dependent oxidoreductase [Oscillatoria sp. FACHB-1406]MBD2578109.1 FAD-dependent oxidoreductase [Oscillatoria sp. FACHB-1406]
MAHFHQFFKVWRRSLASVSIGCVLIESAIVPAFAAAPRSPDETVNCDALVVGGGLAGAATAYEALLAGRTVCMTDITDWVGGQISSQGTSALDETTRQRALLYYSRGYNELRSRIERKYGKLNPGDCWVSVACYIPADANKILTEQLEDAAHRGGGELRWFPSTVIKELELSGDGKLINGAIAIQHQPQAGTPPLNTEPLSQTIEDAYRYENSSRLKKRILRFVPKNKAAKGADWYVVEATETGELIALADVPYKLGLDPRTHREPSSPTSGQDPYCVQGFTYTFAMERTQDPQPQPKPNFYDRYAPYYSYELPRLANFNLVFTYRRIWSPQTGEPESFGSFKWTAPTPGDISMQNWTWGNDYRPGTSQDNLIFSREQLGQTGQLSPSGWMGGLRADTLRRGEENALGYYYWLVAGTTDSQLGANVKKPEPNHRFLAGFDTPMGTAHGLSKYPYMREGRRIVGRPSFGYEDGFMVSEIDISRRDYNAEYYTKTLSPRMYRDLRVALAGLEATSAIVKDTPAGEIKRRSRSTIYPDAVGIAQYPIDFHPCMTQSPPELPGNKEREGVRIGQGSSFPAQIPLRAMIPQKIDNLLVVGKSIATSHTAAAAYRVHSFEWSSGAAAGTTIDFALDKGIFPYQLTATMPRPTRELRDLQQRLQWDGNPIAFPNTSIFNLDWSQW